jgi:hypothetical protein
MRVMRRRASFIDAAIPERIECIDDRFLLIADDRHSARGKSCPAAPRTRTSAIVAEYLTAVGTDWPGR